MSLGFAAARLLSFNPSWAVPVGATCQPTASACPAACPQLPLRSKRQHTGSYPCHLTKPPAACRSPSCSSHHFQSADALSVVQLSASAGGGLLAATFDSEGLAAWRLPAAGSVEKLGVASEVRAVLLLQASLSSELSVASVSVAGFVWLSCCKLCSAEAKFPVPILLVPLPTIPSLSPPCTGWEVSRPPGTFTPWLSRPAAAGSPQVRAGVAGIWQPFGCQLPMRACRPDRNAGVGVRCMRTVCCLLVPAIQPHHSCIPAQHAALLCCPTAGGEGGLLCLYSLDPSAPPRWVGGATDMQRLPAWHEDSAACCCFLLHGAALLPVVHRARGR